MESSTKAIYKARAAPAVDSRNAYTWLTAKGLRHPDSPAIASLYQPSEYLRDLAGAALKDRNDGHLQWTYSEFNIATERLAGFLYAGAHVKPGDAVIVFAENCVEWCLFLWTTFRLGAVFLPQNPSVLRRKDELDNILRSVNAKVVLTRSLEDAKAFQNSASPLPVQLIAGGQDDALQGWQYLETVQPKFSGSVPSLPAPDRSATVYIQTTSGSTNLPKGCPLSFGNVEAEIGGLRSFWNSRWDEEGTSLLQTGAAYGAVCYLSSLSCWEAGGQVVIAQATFDVDKALRAIQVFGITHLLLFPSHLTSILASSLLKTSRPTTLKFVGVSGDFVSEQKMQQFKEELQIGRLVFYWGMSEGAPVFGWEQDEPVRTIRSGIPMLGRPLPGSSAKVCASGTNVPTERGEIGDLHVSSNMVIHRYLGDRNREDFYNDDDGRWLKTGDLAIMDESGAVAVCGRSKEIIKCSSMRIVPSIIEEWLQKEFDVEAKVVGAPNEAQGEVPAAVIKRDELDQRQRQKMGAELEKTYAGGYCLPHVFLLKELGLSDWPYGQTRKVSKKDLKEMIEQQLK